MAWQGIGGTKLSEGCEKQQEGNLRVHLSEEKDNESVSPLINERGELATAEVEKAEVLNGVFSSVFSVSQASHTSHIPEPLGGG